MVLRLRERLQRRVRRADDPAGKCHVPGAGSRAHDGAALAEPLASCRPCGAASTPGPDCGVRRLRLRPGRAVFIAACGISGSADSCGRSRAARRRFAKALERRGHCPVPEHVGAWWDKQGAHSGCRTPRPRVRRASRAAEPIYSNASEKPGSSKASPKRRQRVLQWSLSDCA